MNIRNIKLELTVALMNEPSTINHVGKVKELMQDFQGQVGNFRGAEIVSDTDLDDDHSLQTMALAYDNCVVNIDLVTNNTTRMVYVNRFDLAA
ncbi:MAG: hypothetical protein AAGJ18_30685 [Bacteroidota bacterium]